MRIAFVSKMDNKLLDLILKPLRLSDKVEEIGLFRTIPFGGNKIKWYRIPGFFQRLKVIAELYRFVLLLINVREYDVVIGCFQVPHGLMAWIAGRIFRKPVAQMIVCEIEWNLVHFIGRTVMMRSDACTVMGRICRDRLEDAGFKGLVEIIPLPVSAPMFGVPERPERKYDICVVAAFAKEKDFPWMMKVLSVVKERKPDLKVAIRANGDKNKELPVMIKKYGLQDNVELPGYLTEEELSGLFYSSGILLLTSSTEGLTTVVLEALYHGLPPVVTAVGNLPWLVRDGIEGRIVPHEDTAGMTEAVLSILDSEELRKKFSINSMKRAEELEEEFNPANLAAKWEKLLSGLLD